MITLIKIRTPVRYADGLDIQRQHGVELENSPGKTAKLIFLQHTPVFTLGRRTEASHLPVSEDDLAVRTGAEVVKTDRAGSITYHAPGQLTAYMLLNLQAWSMGIHQHLEMLEECSIQALAEFGITGTRAEGMTGVWVESKIQNPKSKIEKVCAIGVSARRWVTYHGLSLNVSLDLSPFDEIVPCGLHGYGVTSMSKILNRDVHISEVENAMSRAFSKVYQSEIEIGMV